MGKRGVSSAVLVILIGMMSLLPGSTMAVPMIQFLPGDISTAQIGYAGGASGLSTSFPIPIAFIRGIDTPVSISDLTVTNGSLDFITGALTSFSTNGGSEWRFASGGSIEVTGGIPALGISDGTMLLSGSFDVVSLTGIDSTLPTDGLLSATLTDTKNATLLASFGFASDATFGGHLTLNARLVPFPGISLPAFLSTGIGSVSLTNTVSVAEPVTVALFGVGLAAIGYQRRRRLTAYHLGGAAS